jgi:hypothetical protein
MTCWRAWSLVIVVAVVGSACGGDEPPPAAPTSVLTALTPDACTTVELNEDEGWSTQSCAGTHGYELLVHDGDARQSITVIDPAGREHAQDYWSVVSAGFSTLGEHAEWRLAGAGADAAPTALIVAVNAAEWNDAGETNAVTYLAVSKITAGAICVTDSIGPGDDQAATAMAAADSSAGRPCLADAPPVSEAPPMPAGRYCYALDEETMTARVRFDLNSIGEFGGRTEATVHDEANSYFTSYVQEFNSLGVRPVQEPGAPQAPAFAEVRVTTWIEYDEQKSIESWVVTADRLETDQGVFVAVACDAEFAVADGHEQLGIDESPIHTRYLALELGLPVTVSNGVVRGERDRYLVEVEGGRQLELTITSVEDNAVFDVIAPSGIVLMRESMQADVFLPHSGEYEIIVGGTRGNAGYDLTVTLR